MQACRKITSFTLDTYSHVLPHMQDAAATQVEALLLQIPDEKL
jgi:hypothetical protein